MEVLDSTTSSNFDDSDFERAINASESRVLFVSDGIVSNGIGESDIRSPDESTDQWRDNLILSIFHILTVGKAAYASSRARLSDARLARPKATMIASYCSWLLSGLIACLAVGLSTKDFLQERSSNLLSQSFVPTNIIEMPVISFCSARLGLLGYPLFAVGTKGIRSSPLFTAGMYHDREGNHSRTFWPEFFKDGRINFAFRGPENKSCAEEFQNFDLQTASVSKRSLDSQSAKNRCQFCLQIGRKTKIAFSKSRRRKGPRGNGLFIHGGSGVQIQLLRLIAIEECLDMERDIFNFSPGASLLMARAIRDRIDDLVKKGS